MMKPPKKRWSREAAGKERDRQQKANSPASNDDSTTPLRNIPSEMNHNNKSIDWRLIMKED